MRKSMITAGMFELLACMFMVVEPGAAIPSGFPGVVIEGSRQPGDNHYNFVKRLIIGHDHPYNRYSTARLFWAEKPPSDVANRKITYFRCVNQTPRTANALIHVNHGGIGTTELVLDVAYAPVRFVLINAMIITCDIYTGGSDTHFDNDTEIMPATVEEGRIISTDYTTDEIPTTKSFGKMFATAETNSSDDTESAFRMSTIGSERNSEGVSTKSVKRITQSIERDSTTPGTTESANGNRNISRTGTEKMGARIGVTSERMAMTITPIEKKNRNSLSNQKINENTITTTMMTIVNRNTSHSGDKSLSREEETGGERKGENSEPNSESSGDEKKQTNSGGQKTCARKGKKTTMEIESCETIEIIPSTRQNDTSSGDNFENSSQTVNRMNLRCKEEGLGTNETRSETNGTSLWDINDDPEAERDGISEAEDSIKKQTTTAVYNFLVKILPSGLKKKIGLAKISY